MNVNALCGFCYLFIYCVTVLFCFLLKLLLFVQWTTLVWHEKKSMTAVQLLKNKVII